MQSPILSKFTFHLILNKNCENENRRQTYKAAKTIGRQQQQQQQSLAQMSGS